MANYQGRGGRLPYMIVVHTNQGPNDLSLPDFGAENLVAWMRNTTGNSAVSYHCVVDDDSLVRDAPDEMACWAVMDANNVTLNLCFIGYAEWDTSEWMKHPNMLAIGAAQVQRWLAKYPDIHPVRLSSNDVAARRSGICGHINITQGWPVGNHTDPGNGFPWNYFMGLVLGNQPHTFIGDANQRSRRRHQSMLLPASNSRIDMIVPTDVVEGWCGAANMFLYGNTGESVVYYVAQITDRGNTKPLVEPLLDNKDGQNFVQWWPAKWPLKKGVTAVLVSYKSTGGMVAHPEYEK